MWLREEFHPYFIGVIQPNFFFAAVFVDVDAAVGDGAFVEGFFDFPQVFD
jgi:hypothetical protein